MKEGLRRRFPELLHGWNSLTNYQRFERLVSLILTVAIGLVVVVAVFYLVTNVFTLLFMRVQDPFDYRLFQAVFDMILTVLIAMEFNNSIVRSMEAEGRVAGMVQVEVVVLIAIMALVRKFMVMEVEKLDAMHVLSLGAAILALGITYWLLRHARAQTGSRRSGAEGREQQPPDS